jgi:hypothetical protein
MRALLLALCLLVSPALADSPGSQNFTAERAADALLCEPALASRNNRGDWFPLAQACCKVCRKGKACGDSCIARDKTCRKGPGCACDAKQ